MILLSFTQHSFHIPGYVNVSVKRRLPLLRLRRVVDAQAENVVGAEEGRPERFQHKHLGVRVRWIVVALEDQAESIAISLELVLIYILRED